MQYLTTDDLSREMKVTRQTVWKWRKLGMPHIKIGRSVRFVKTDVDKWLEQYQKGVVENVQG